MIKQKVIFEDKPVFSSKFFQVKKVTVPVKNNKTEIHHVIECDPTVLIFPMGKKNEIYLISQYRYMLSGNVLGAAAGHIEKNETPLAAAKRELEEETGIVALQWEELREITLSRSMIYQKQHLFLAKDLEIKKSRLEDGEDIGVVKLPFEKAVEKVMTGEITHAASIIGILLLDELKKRRKL